MAERGFGGTRGHVGFPLEIVAATDLPLLHRLREKTVLQSTNRKLERRVKELSIQIDDERQHVNDQKDQVRTTAGPKQPFGRDILHLHEGQGWLPLIGLPDLDFPCGRTELTERTGLGGVTGSTCSECL